MLLFVAGVLYLFRGIYAEVVGALPLNGGAYNALLNTTSKRMASLAVTQTNLDNRRITWPRGKTLGGTSSLNGMIYIRGHARDYDLWRQMGLAGWSYADVLPYFKRAEGNERGANTFHGADGPLNVTEAHHDNPLFDAFIEAGSEAGYPVNSDFNGAEQEGFGRYQFTIRNARRWSTAAAYLRPALSRPNLTVETEALTQRIVIAKGRAEGVVYRQGRQVITAYATREVLLAAGAVNSPQILMLSGVGDADHLGSHGIAPVIDLPEVGRLQHSIELWSIVL